MLCRVRSVKHFFQNALSRAHHGVLVPTSLLVGPIDSLPFATRFLASLKKIFLRKSMGGKNCQLFTASATDCRTLARHALKLICQTTLNSPTLSFEYFVVRNKMGMGSWLGLLQRHEIENIFSCPGYFALAMPALQ